MRKLPLLILALLVVAGCGSKKDSHTEDDNLDWGALKEWLSLSGDEADAPASAPPRVAPMELPPLVTSGRLDEIFNDSNYVQYAFAETLGIKPLYTLSDAYNTRRPLIKIESCPAYKVDNLTHSMPYLVPEAAALLEEIGVSFCDSVEKRFGNRDNRIIVTSLLRSPYLVRKLRRVNTNARDSSTHMFATTFDIAYNKFYSADTTRAVDGWTLKNILAAVLLEKRKEGKCLVKYEIKSPCFHITVAK